MTAVGSGAGAADGFSLAGVADANEKEDDDEEDPQALPFDK